MSDDITHRNKDWEFNYRLSRLNSRESSSIALAGIASSASLVLLGLQLQPDVLPNTAMTTLGISFSFLGFAYNEITCRTLLQRDNEKIKQMLKLDDESKVIKGARIARLCISRSLLLLPWFGWAFIDPSLSQYYCWLVIFSIIAIIGLVITHPNAFLDEIKRFFKR